MNFLIKIHKIPKNHLIFFLPGQNDINKDFAKIYLIYESDGKAICKQIQFDEYGDFVDSPKEFTTFFSNGFKDAMEIATLKKYQEEKWFMNWDLIHETVNKQN